MIDELFQLFARAWVWPTPTCRTEHGAMGQTLTADVPPAAWLHPWHTSLAFLWLPNDKKPGWTATILPGFVNGQCPIIATTVGNAPTRTIWREQTRKKKRVDLSDPKAAIDSPLYDLPAIALSWRSIGRDGEGEAVPKFFSQLGVGDPPKDNTAALLSGGAISAEDTASALGNRLLRACDLVLVKPRTALTAATDIGTPFVDSVIVTQTLGLRAPDPDQKLRVTARSKFTAQSDAGIHPWEMDYQEQTWDEQLVATVYLLSPPDAALGSEPDGSWTPYVKHNLFWNLDWAQPITPDVPIPDPLRLVVPLALGMGQTIINQILAGLNDANQQLANEIAAHSMGGRFWTV